MFSLVLQCVCCLIVQIIHTDCFSFSSCLLELIRPLCLETQIGGMEEYKICQGIREGRISKPVVSWCIGTCATMFSSEVRPALLRHLVAVAPTKTLVKVVLLPPAGSVWPCGRLCQPGFRNGGGQEPGPAGRRGLRPKEL